MSISYGPDLPQGMRYPCTININSSHIFIYGQSIHSFNYSLSYIYDISRNTFIDLAVEHGDAISYNKISCAYIKPKNHVLIAIENKMLTVNLTSFKWNQMKLPVEDGVIFNSDLEQKYVYYVAPKNDQMSGIYKVTNSNVCSFFSVVVLKGCFSIPAIFRLNCVSRAGWIS